MAPHPHAAAPSGAGARILVVDDADLVRRLVRTALQREGFQVQEAADGEAALAAVRERRPDLVLLDLDLPRVDGRAVLEVLRADDVPVIILTGDAADATEVWGLEAGADDFVAKPVPLRQLVARVRAVLRRAGPAATPPVLTFDGLVIDAVGRRVSVDGRPVELTAKELDLLVALATARGRVLTRDELLRTVWASEPGWQDPGTVAEHVYRVRQKIERTPSAPRWITTVRRAGYRFEG